MYAERPSSWLQFAVGFALRFACAKGARTAARFWTSASPRQKLASVPRSTLIARVPATVDYLSQGREPERQGTGRNHMGLGSRATGTTGHTRAYGLCAYECKLKTSIAAASSADFRGFAARLSHLDLRNSCRTNPYIKPSPRPQWTTPARGRRPTSSVVQTRTVCWAVRRPRASVETCIPATHN